MTQPILNGTWFEFRHPSAAEGTYWNPALAGFTENQWRTKIQEIQELGMTYIVLMASAYVSADEAECYFPGGVYPFAPAMACKNPIEVLMDETSRLGMRVFMSCGFYGDWTQASRNISNPEVESRAFSAMEQLYHLYGHFSSFYGWYLPDETAIDGYFREEFITYVNLYRARARKLNHTKKMLVAPYGLWTLQADDKYIEQLKRLDCDFIAYQDGVGVETATSFQTGEYFRKLRRVHDLADGPGLWADIELFRFEGNRYRSPLVPGRMERIRSQMEVIAPYVDEILCYQYTGLMNPPNSQAVCGHRDSLQLYLDYRNYLKERNISL